MIKSRTLEKAASMLSDKRDREAVDIFTQRLYDNYADINLLEMWTNIDDRERLVLVIDWERYLSEIMERARLEDACARENPDYDESDRANHLCTTCGDDFARAVRDIAEMIRATIRETNTTLRSWGSPLRLYEEDIELDTDPYEFFLYGDYDSDTLITIEKERNNDICRSN